jgi:hypothetical protein
MSWMKVLPLSLLLCAMGCDYGPHWELLSSTPTARAEIDTNRIGQRGDLRTAEMRITYTADASERHAGDWGLVFTQYNCTTRESRQFSPTYPPGRPGGPPPPYHAVAPGTFDEAALKYVCR